MRRSWSVPAVALLMAHLGGGCVEDDVDLTQGELGARAPIDAQQSIFKQAPFVFEGTCNFLACCSVYGQKAAPGETSFGCGSFSCAPAKHRQKDQYVPLFFCG